MPSPKEFRFVAWGSETITQELLENCAKLFSENYGTWGEMGLFPGRPVKLSHSRLKSEYLFNPQTCSLITADTGVGGEIVAHAFVCSFPFLSGKSVALSTISYSLGPKSRSFMLIHISNQIGFRLRRVDHSTRRSEGHASQRTCN